MGHRDIKWSNAVGKTAPTDMLETELSQAFNVKMHYLQSTIKESKIKWGIPLDAIGIQMYVWNYEDISGLGLALWIFSIYIEVEPWRKRSLCKISLWRGKKKEASVSNTKNQMKRSKMK